MVKISQIRRYNASYAAQDHSGLVCVFAGATAGIGAATLREMVGLLRSSTFYVLGREPHRYQDKLNELKRIGPTNEIIFVETQISLISGVDRASAIIGGAADKVDLICVSPGGMPFQGAVYTSEGLESCFAVSYYSRLRLISNLLPLLHKSSQPRVLSILNGSKEKKINEEDLGLEKNWGIAAVVNHTTMCTSLAFDYLAFNDAQKHITFLHVTPGFVSTDTVRTAYPSKEKGLVQWALISLFQIILGWIIKYFGMAVEESGQRHAYELTSDNFLPGSWRVSRLNDVVPDKQVLVQYRENGLGSKVWDFTVGVWEKTLAKGTQS